MNDLLTRECPVCGGRDADFLCQRPDLLAVERCQTCGMMFVRRIPSERQLTDYYQTYASQKGYTKQRPLSWLERAAACSQNLYIEATEQTGGLVGRTVLDIGCSTGDFLELIKFKGGRPEGVEIDAPAREEARSRGYTVHATLPGSGPYDVTSALQVLEHLSNPDEMVAAMVRLTKPEGRVLLAVPNAGEVSHLGRDWLGFRVDLEHFNYFTTGTLADLLRRHGLLVEHFWEHRQPHVVRTDIEPKVAGSSWRERLRDRLDRKAVALFRILCPPPERFLEGTFTLSVLARRV
jgi:2-polyprenyl-3-methyl-5-hydroxy-6-metoxy-1,4-benzoquinol methylase